MSAATEAARPLPLRAAAPFQPAPPSTPAVWIRAWPSPARAAAAATLAGADAVSAAAVAASSGLPGRRPEPDPSSTEPATPHLRVVPPPKLSAAQRRRRARAVLLGTAGLVVAVAFGLVYLHVQMAQRQFTLDQLNSQVQQQQAQYQKLRLKVAELGSPQNVISIAVGRLGMHQPASVSYLAPPTTVGHPAPPPASSGSSASTVVTAPPGDANWPEIKSQLAGIP